MPDWLYERLTRRTSGGRFIPQIDGLRFVAIMTVVLFHIAIEIQRAPLRGMKGTAEASPLYAVLKGGHYGVELFFVISGFVLALPFAGRHLLGKRPVRLSSYFKRRLTRLEPPFILNLLFAFAVRIVVKGQSVTELLPHFLAGLFYQHSLIFGEWSKLNVVHWSLEVEVQFYVLAPLFGVVFSLRNTWLRRGVIALTAYGFVAAQYLAPDLFPRLNLAAFVQYFAVGFLLADLYLTEWKEPARNPVAWDVAGTVAWLLMAVVTMSKPVALWTMPVLALVAYGSAFRGRFMPQLFAMRWLTVIGGMCYTIYLYHYLMIAAVTPVLQDRLPAMGFAANMAVQTAIQLPPILLISTVLFVLVEKPCMDRDWPSKLWAALRSRSSRPPQVR